MPGGCRAAARAWRERVEALMTALVPDVPGLPDAVVAALRAAPRRWLVTGSAGFVGSHLVEALLRVDQEVVSVDNFATGHCRNLDEIRRAVGERAWRRHTFIEGDIVDVQTCVRACRGADIVLHQAALGSVPRSIEDPLSTHAANGTGFLNILVAARDASGKRFVYAVPKYLHERSARVFDRCYGTASVGLRYFNVFGPRQDPQGAYAAVIPRWAAAMLAGVPVTINGDGETTRDFCYIGNVVQANLLAATTSAEGATGQVYNIAVGGRISLNHLFATIKELLIERHPTLRIAEPIHGEFRPGDVRHSQADISKARRLLGYHPTRDTRAGLREALPWYEALEAANAADQKLRAQDVCRAT